MCKPALLIAVAALTASALANEAPVVPVEILSENGSLDVATGAYVLTGNVRIRRGELTVRADEARSFSNEDGELERVELYGNPTDWDDVLEDGNRVSGSSDQILYDFTRNLITMQGNAQIKNVQGEFSGTQLVYDLDSQNLVGDGNVRLLIEPATAQRATQQIERGSDGSDATDTPPPDDGSEENGDDNLD